MREIFDEKKNRRRNIGQQSISFILPAYNEKANIERTVDIIKSVGQRLTSDFEIIIVDDASTDGTIDLINALSQKDSCVSGIYLKRNTKLGGALAKGICMATKNVIIYVDSDLPVAAQDIISAFSLLGKAEIISGCAKNNKGENVKREIMSIVYNFLVQQLFRLNLKDINAGFKIYKADVIKGMSLRSKSPFINVEMLVKAKRNGCVIVQYPVEMRLREKGQSVMGRFSVVWATVCDMVCFKLSLCFRPFGKTIL